MPSALNRNQRSSEIYFQASSLESGKDDNISQVYLNLHTSSYLRIEWACNFYYVGLVWELIRALTSSESLE